MTGILLTCTRTSSLCSISPQLLTFLCILLMVAFLDILKGFVWSLTGNIPLMVSWCSPVAGPMGFDFYAYSSVIPLLHFSLFSNFLADYGSKPFIAYPGRLTVEGNFCNSQQACQAFTKSVSTVTKS